MSWTPRAAIENWIFIRGFSSSLRRLFYRALAHHDTQQFEIYCYYNNLRHDMVTLRLQQYGPHWRDCFNWTDEELAAA